MVLARSTAAVCALAAVAVLGLTACGKQSKDAGTTEPASEGLAIPIGGIEYNVFITRQLNPEIVPDNAYYKGPDPGKDNTLYGIFLQVCNHGKRPVQTAESFKVVDNQDNEFEPVPLPKDNAFSYQPRRLGPSECIPESGSVAQLGPTAGSMLLFKLPVEDTENRPLELEITSPLDVLKAKRETRTIELDL
jgi:hypothetical protein